MSDLEYRWVLSIMCAVVITPNPRVETDRLRRPLTRSNVRRHPHHDREVKRAQRRSRLC